MSFLPRLLSVAPATLAISSLAAAPYVHEAPLKPGAESPEAILAKAANLVPSPRQMAYHRMEFIAFVHFGPNTFTGVEWGSGKESAAIFNPGDTLDTDQWCRVMKSAGMRMALITIKHHDGFCLWQTRYNDKFSVRGIPWRNGKGDVLRELSASCRKHGLKLGVYLSPADLYQMESAGGLYGNGSKARPSVIPTDPAALLSAPETVRADKPAGAPVFRFEADDYNRYFLNQLYELLTEYGPVHEVWFDGAHPKQKGGQTYIKDKWFEMIRALAPEAVIFGGPDVRWCGNEGGGTRDAEWNAVPVQGLVEAGKDRREHDIASDEKLRNASYDVYGEKQISNFLYYLISEVNTSIRAGWFWRNEHEQSVRTADDVFDIYERAVGGNAVFLLNLPPDKSGRVAPREVACLEEVGRRIRATYENRDLMVGATSNFPALLDGNLATAWQSANLPPEATITLARPTRVNRVVLQEAIETVGQRVAEHVLEARVNGAWHEVARAKTIGYKRILRFPAVTTDAFRVRVTQSRLAPALAEFSAHYYDAPLPVPVIARGKDGRVVISGDNAPAFGWKSHGQGDASVTAARSIRYTIDGSEPGPASPEYRGAFDLPQGGVVKALVLRGDKRGPVGEKAVPILSSGWKVVAGAEASSKTPATAAIDGNADTAWLATPGLPRVLEVDMGRVYPAVRGFNYLPRRNGHGTEGLVERGEISFSTDGKTWGDPLPFVFGNLENDPSPRTQLWMKPFPARYFRFTAKAGTKGATSAGAAEIEIIAP